MILIQKWFHQKHFQTRDQRGLIQSVRQILDFLVL